MRRRKQKPLQEHEAIVESLSHDGKGICRVGFRNTEPVWIITTIWFSLVIPYIFAALIGFSTTIAEPSLLAVAVKANEVSGGTIGTFYLRFVVAIGVAIALVIGTYRIVVGDSLATYIMVGYVIVMIQTIF